MSLLIGFLTFILVLNCLFLMLLILIQLPKKEAGAGIAFGGAATDALFGAGSGNALTKLTKSAATFFVGMSILLSVLNMHAANAGTRRLQRELSRQSSGAAPVIPVAPAGSPTAATPTTTNLGVQAPPAAPANSLMTSGLTNMAVPVPAPAAPTAPAPAAPAAPDKGPAETPAK